MRKIYIALGGILVILLGFTFIPFGVDYDAIVDQFNSMSTQSASYHAIDSKQLRVNIDAATGSSDSKTIALIFPFKANAGESIRITSFVTEVRHDTGDTEPHAGTDIAGNVGVQGQQLLACANGVVVVNDPPDSGSWGNMVIISDPITGLYYRYCHMRDRSSLTVGTVVTAGQLVGYCGKTSGGSIGVTGPHLHFEIFIPAKGSSQRIPKKYYLDESMGKEADWISKLGMVKLGSDPRYVTSIFCPQIKYRDVNYPTSLVLAASVTSTMGFPSKLERYTGG